jgi:atypical dual specificity phosphatase
VAQPVEGTQNVFTWLVEDRLAACPNPSVSGQARRRLQAARITVVINLYEKANDPEVLTELGAREVHLPVLGSMPPSPDQFDMGIAEIEAALARGDRVVVHCGAGLGRAGTLLAGYFVAQGMTADDAIARVRAARPGSVETLEQEVGLARYAAQRRADRD